MARAVDGSTPGRRAFVRQLAWRDWYAHLFANDPISSTYASSRSTTTSCGAPIRPRCSRGNAARPATRSSMLHARTRSDRLDAQPAPSHHRLVPRKGSNKRLADRGTTLSTPPHRRRRAAERRELAVGRGHRTDAAPYFRVLNPQTQAHRFDPNGDYVRRLVPELAALPGPSIHVPSQLGPLELAGANVILGESYPYPSSSTARPANERSPPTQMRRTPCEDRSQLSLSACWAFRLTSTLRVPPTHAGSRGVAARRGHDQTLRGVDVSAKATSRAWRLGRRYVTPAAYGCAPVG